MSNEGKQREAELSGNKYLATEQHIKAQIDKGLLFTRRSPSLNSSTKRTAWREQKYRDSRLSRIGSDRLCTRFPSRVIASKHRTPQAGMRPASLKKSTSCRSPTQVLSSERHRWSYFAGSRHNLWNINNPAIRSLYAEIGRHSRLQTQLPGYYQLPPGDEQLVKQLLKITHDLGVPAGSKEIAIITVLNRRSVWLYVHSPNRVTSWGCRVYRVTSAIYFYRTYYLQALEIPSSVSYGIETLPLQSALTTAKRCCWHQTLPTRQAQDASGCQSKGLEINGSLPIIEDDVFGSLCLTHQLRASKSLMIKIESSTSTHCLKP